MCICIHICIYICNMVWHYINEEMYIDALYEYKGH